MVNRRCRWMELIWESLSHKKTNILGWFESINPCGISRMSRKDTGTVVCFGFDLFWHIAMLPLQVHWVDIFQWFSVHFSMVKTHAPWSTVGLYTHICGWSPIHSWGFMYPLEGFPECGMTINHHKPSISCLPLLMVNSYYPMYIIPTVDG